MKNILAELQKVLELAQAKEKELTQSLQESHALANGLKADIERIKAKEQNLAQREAAVKEIEDIVALEQKAKEDQEKANLGLKELEIQRNAFISTRESYEADLRKRILDANMKDDALKVKEQELMDRAANIENEITAKVEEIIRK